MTDFDTVLAKATRKDKPIVHGVVAKCVDKTGKELYSKVAGYDSIAADAAPLRKDAVFKVASCTKLVTSIALLQCVERGLLTLDQPIDHVLPELKSKSIIARCDSGSSDLFTYRTSLTRITARHLLSHTSGMTLPIVDTLIADWDKQHGHSKSDLVVEKYNVPLLFEPGEGWVYGPGLDWAGLAVTRLTGLNLEDYMNQEIWQRLGRPMPYPTFHISRHPEYKKRLMSAAQREGDGSLSPFNPSHGEHLINWGDNPVDEEGGNGLAMTVDDYLAVTQDLISDSPKLLSLDMVDMLFSPQLAPDSSALRALKQSRGVWNMLAGPVGDDVNHSLGGLLTIGAAPDIHQPKNCLAWVGACNPVWFANRELGVAGFFATEIWPLGDAEVHKLVNAWKRDFWVKYLRV